MIIRGSALRAIVGYVDAIQMINLVLYASGLFILAADLDLVAVPVPALDGHVRVPADPNALPGIAQAALIREKLAAPALDDHRVNHFDLTVPRDLADNGAARRSDLRRRQTPAELFDQGAPHVIEQHVDLDGARVQLSDRSAHQLQPRIRVQQQPVRRLRLVVDEILERRIRRHWRVCACRALPV